MISRGCIGGAYQRKEKRGGGGGQIVQRGVRMWLQQLPRKGLGRRAVHLCTKGGNHTFGEKSERVITTDQNGTEGAFALKKCGRMSPENLKKGAWTNLLQNSNRGGGEPKA